MICLWIFSSWHLGWISCHVLYYYNVLLWDSSLIIHWWINKEHIPPFSLFHTWSECLLGVLAQMVRADLVLVFEKKKSKVCSCFEYHSGMTVSSLQHSRMVMYASWKMARFFFTHEIPKQLSKGYYLLNLNIELLYNRYTYMMNGFGWFSMFTGWASLYNEWKCWKSAGVWARPFFNISCKWKKIPDTMSAVLQVWEVRHTSYIHLRVLKSLEKSCLCKLCCECWYILNTDLKISLIDYSCYLPDAHWSTA